MKYLLSLLAASAALMVVALPAHAEGETKKVCIDVQGKDGKPEIDKKTGKVKQSCKEVKKHKKHEGTKVEDAKKK